MKDFVVIVSPDGAARLEAEEIRLAGIKARSALPEICGDAIAEAPARGAFRVFEPQALYRDGEGGFAVKHAGYRGRSAIQRADVFDVMAAKAARHNKPSPLTPGQVAIGRHYRDLVERHACAGLKCSSIACAAASAQARPWWSAVFDHRDADPAPAFSTDEWWTWSAWKIAPSATS
ncbi:hypothetical protein [Pseudophaeobacter sp.]|uniref:hypothetical protein n=1 Tax=Pseudophaeobacter sp. TaxID=1971739 RepID=UPI00262FC960|nr:hypothetical protein [Pseudophaeobacter sp.]